MSENKKFRNFVDCVKKGDTFVVFSLNGRLTKDGVKSGTFQRNGAEELYANGKLIINGQKKTLEWAHKTMGATKDLFLIGKDGDDAFSLPFSCFERKEVEKLKAAASSALITVQGFLSVNGNGELSIDVHKVLDVKAPKNAGDNPSTTSTADEAKVTSAVEDAATKKEEEKMEEINPSDLPFDNWY